MIYIPFLVCPLKLVSSHFATISNCPADCNAATAISKIPKKKNIVAVSIFFNVVITDSFDFSFLVLFLCIISVIVHKTPKDRIIPRYGGKLVIVLNIGTNNNPNTQSRI